MIRNAHDIVSLLKKFEDDIGKIYTTVKRMKSAKASISDPTDNQILTWDENLSMIVDGLWQLPAADGAANDVIYTDGAGNLGTIAPGVAAVAGADMQIQYNLAGAMGAEAAFIYNYNTNAMMVDNIGIAVAAPLARLDISYGRTAIFVGADWSATTRTDNADKHAAVAMVQYDTDENGSCWFYGHNTLTDNLLYIGGGFGDFNAATYIRFYTADNNDTLAGSLRFEIEPDGDAHAYNDLDVDGTTTTAELNVEALTAGYLPYQAAGNLLDDSIVYQTGARIGINTATPQCSLHVQGSFPIIRTSDSNSTNTTEAVGAIEYYHGNNTARLGYVGFGSAGNLDLYINNEVNGNTRFYTNDTERMRIENDGDVGISITAPWARLDVCYGGLTMFLGADSGAITRTDDTNKYSTVGMVQYDVDEEGFCLHYGTSDGNHNTVFIGGGTASLNAASRIRMYTAGDKVTLTGTERMRIESTGEVYIFTCNDAGADVNKFLVLDASDIVDYRTGAEVLSDLSGDAAGAFSWNNQNLTNVATLTATNVQVTSLTAGYVPYDNAGTLDDSIIYYDGTDVAISTTSPLARFDVSYGSITMFLGADSNAATRTDNTNKFTTVGMPQYDTDEEGVCAFTGFHRVADNSLYIGGGTGLLNACTEIKFYTAANTNTLSGTSRMIIEGDGDIGISTDGPLGRLDVCYGGATIVMGADSSATTRTDNTVKYARIETINYDTDEELVLAVLSQNQQTANYLYIGGGDASLNAVTEIRFHTADNATTLDGTLRMRIVGTDGEIYMYSLSSGATQAAAGAAANELWVTSGHASLPDNVVMIGA